MNRVIQGLGKLKSFIKKGGAKDGKIHFVVFHYLEHLDEFACWDAWMRFESTVEAVFPGICEAEIVHMNAGDRPPKVNGEIKKADELEKLGVLFIGCGGGRLDEHKYIWDGKPKEDKKDKKKKKSDGPCAFSLFMKAVGLDKDDKIAHVIHAVRLNDVIATHNDIARVVGIMWDHLPEKPGKIYDIFKWVKQGLEAKYGDFTKGQDFSLSYIDILMSNAREDKKTCSWWLRQAQDILALCRKKQETETAKEFKDKAQIIALPSGEMTVKLAVVESDDPQMGIVAKAPWGGNCDVVILKNSDGHVTILSNTKKKDKELGRIVRSGMQNLAMLVMVFEQKKKKERCSDKNLARPIETSFEKLTSGINIPGLPWFFFTGTSLFNGGKRTVGTPKTLLNLKNLETLAGVAFRMGFHKCHEDGKCCKEGCPLFCFQQKQCRTNRYNITKQKNKKE